MKFLSSAVLFSLAGFASSQVTVCDTPDVLGYRCKTTQGGLTLNWGMTPEGTAINFHLRAAAGSGWFGVGWNSLQQMIGSTVVVADNAGAINRYTLPAKVAADVQATRTDIASVQTLSTPAAAVSTTGGVTTMTFTRTRAATDPAFRYSYIVMARRAAATPTTITQHSERYVFYVDFLASLILLSPSTNSPAVTGATKVPVPAGDRHFTSEVILQGLTNTARTYFFSEAYINTMAATLGDTASGNELITCLRQCTVTRVAEWINSGCTACAVRPVVASREVGVLQAGVVRVYFQGRSKKTAAELATAHTAAVTAATAAAIAGGEPALTVATSSSQAIDQTPVPPPVLVNPSVPMSIDNDDDTNGTAGIAAAGSLSALIVIGLLVLAFKPKKEDKEEDDDDSSAPDKEAPEGEEDMEEKEK